MHGQAGNQVFLGVRFSDVPLQDAARHLLTRDRGQGFQYVITPNVQHMVSLLDQPHRLKDLFAGASYTFCDSRVLRRMARLAGKELSLVPGSDLTPRLLDEANAQALKIAIVGPSVAEVAKLSALYPRLHIVVHSPPMGFMNRPEEVDACIEFIEREQAPLVFLAVGFPRQETLARMVADRGNAVGVGLCIGASIDFLTGAQQRAPLWMQRAGLEWLHRLSSNPRRLAARYLIDCPRIFYLALLHRNHVPPASQPSGGTSGLP